MTAARFASFDREVARYRGERQLAMGGIDCPQPAKFWPSPLRSTMVSTSGAFADKGAVTGLQPVLDALDQRGASEGAGSAQ